MNRREEIVLAVCTLVIVLGLSFGFEWPALVWVPLALALPLAILLVSRQVRTHREQTQLRLLYDQKRTDQQHADQQNVAPQPAQNQNQNQTQNQYRLANALLPSIERNYRFLFSCTVCWQANQGSTEVRHADLASLAINAIIARAGEVTAPCSPVDHVRVEQQLAGVLGAWLTDRSGHVVAWAEEITLAVADEDVRRLRTLSELRKEEQLWEYERRLECAKRAYLANDVLKNTGSAVVWWLARHPDQVEETAQLIGTLAQLSAAANNTEVPELFRYLVPEAIRSQPEYESGQAPLSLVAAALDAVSSNNNRTYDSGVLPEHGQGGTRHASGLANELFADMDDSQQALFADTLAGLADRFGGQDLARKIRDLFGVPEPDTLDSSPPDKVNPSGESDQDGSA